MPIVPEEPTTAQVEQESIINLITRLSTQLDELKSKRKNVKEQLDEMLNTHEDYVTVTVKAAEVATAKKQMRERIITEDHDMMVLESQLAEIKDDISMVAESLNVHLITYIKQTGEQQIGERKIRVKATISPDQMKMF